MNKGISITELAQQLEEIENSKRDYIVPTSKMIMTNGRMLNFGQNSYELSKLAHEQIGARLDIPRDYYKRMQAHHPELLDANVNTWLNSTPERRFVRTVNGTVRAFLSDKYKPKENYTVACELLPVLRNVGNVEIMSSQLTEKHMYIKVISHDLTGELQLNKGGRRVGEVLKGGISIRNSEVGCGAFDLSLFALILSCLNGMIREHSMKSYHIGKKLDYGDNESIAFYSRETIEADSKAFMLRVRDTLKYAFDRKKFDEELIQFQRAADNPLNTRTISETIEDVTKRFSLTQTEGKDVLSKLLESNDMSQWGLAQAVTNIANDLDDYERSTELERIGGQIIDLCPTEWKTITRLAA